MKRVSLTVLILAVTIGGSALADYVYRDANGALQTFLDFACQTTKHCSAQVLIDSTGTEKATIGNPLQTAEANSAALLTAVQSSIPAGTATIGAVLSAPNVTPTDASGTITVGGTAQNAIAASATIHGFVLCNIDSTAGSGEPLWFSFTGTAAAATAGSYPLSAPTATTFAGLSCWTTPLGFGSNLAVSVVAATTGHKFSSTTW